MRSPEKILREQGDAWSGGPPIHAGAILPYVVIEAK
jgi:hypothetical protein